MTSLKKSSNSSMQKIRVNLKDRSYPIYVGRSSQLFRRLAAQLGDRTPHLITSRLIQRHCLPELRRRLKRPLRVTLMPDGERFKNEKTVARLYQQLIRQGIDRKSPLLLLGGGVVGDVGGFVAATLLRGLPYFQIPTTLVAQVDSAIGGKVGMDLPEGKNLVGSFYQPAAVFSCLPFLRSLPIRELRAALGEILKYGLIADPALYRLVIRNQKKILQRDLSLLEEIVVRSARIKARLVSRDEREETGLRRLLNFGHTFGHAIEKLTRYRRYRHGEAVAIGIVLAASLSSRLGYCSPKRTQQIRADFTKLGLPVDPPRFPRSAWLRAIGVDKKREGRMIRFVFLKGVGQVVIRPISPERLVDLW